MIDKNKQYKVEIKDISSDGNGVGIIEGIAVFVPHTAAGDVAEVGIKKIHSRYIEGTLIKIVKPSPDRVEPLCNVYEKCGGCLLQHISYSAQLNAKKDIVDSAIQRLGGFKEFSCEEILGMDNPIRYRNKCVFQFGTTKNGKIVSGFYAQKSHNVVSAPDCMLGDEINADINRAIISYMNENKVAAYHDKTDKGLVKRVFIRTSHHTDEIMVVISINGGILPDDEKLIEKLKAVSDRISSVYVNINKDKNNRGFGRKNRRIYGNLTISDTLCGTEFEISPASFFQINPVMTEKLYNRALLYADISKADTVLDVYCGIGTISLAAAQQAKKVIGVEIVEQAIKDAEKNAKNNGINNAEFYAESAQDAVPKLISEGVRPDIVILDPPRKGSDEETLDAIITAQPKRIVYVSCNPSTLARDAKYIASHGYKMVKGTAVDQFPQTNHVETVVLMSRKDK